MWFGLPHLLFSVLGSGLGFDGNARSHYYRIPPALPSHISVGTVTCHDFTIGTPADMNSLLPFARYTLRFVAVAGRPLLTLPQTLHRMQRPTTGTRTLSWCWVQCLSVHPVQQRGRCHRPGLPSDPGEVQHKRRASGCPVQLISAVVVVVPATQLQHADHTLTSNPPHSRKLIT